MGPLLVGKPFLHESIVSNGHSEHHQASFLLKSLAFPSISSNDVHVRGFHGRTIPDFGLAEVALDACLMEEGVPDLHKDLCNAIRIAQHVYVVEVGENHLALTQGGIDL